MTEKEKYRFEQLLEKYRGNSMKEDEFRQFIGMLNREGLREDQPWNMMSQDDWKESEPILEKIILQQKKQRRHTILVRWAWRSAAAMALLCMVWLIWPQNSQESITYQTEFGETKNIELPDGSKVLLNANSRITWSGDWQKQKTRSVVLKGEAFFEVVKVPSIFFEVVASDVRVKVLGTEFNVRNRGEEVDVFLHEGKVNLEIATQENKMIEMKPGDFVQYDQEANILSAVHNKRMEVKASWVDGMLEFENEDVRSILKEFEELYGKKFLIENEELANRRMDFSLPYSDWELVRKALEIAIGAEFTVKQDTIIVK